MQTKNQGHQCLVCVAAGVKEWRNVAAMAMWRQMPTHRDRKSESGGGEDGKDRRERRRNTQRSRTGRVVGGVWE